MYKNSPYKEIPEDLMKEYTLDDKIPILNWWLNNSKNNNIIWSKRLIDDYRRRLVSSRIRSMKEGCGGYGCVAVNNIYTSLEKYNIRNKNVGVLGSLTPWIEAMLLNFNNTVTTIEYNVPKCNYDRLRCINYFTEFQTTSNLYDCIVSFSSIEHSGLGGYGDPLDPNGDIKTMNDIHKNLKPNGLMIWGGPVGHDALVWNVHRVYGKIRLPLLFEGFNELEWIGFDKNELLNSELHNNAKQPVIVLSKK